MLQGATDYEMTADYPGLVAAVHEAEAAGDVERRRATLDAFLAEFPLCYGYWKRYADFEASLGDAEAISRADAVYERGLVLGRYCVDLWAFYGAHAAAHWAKPEETRALFEKPFETNWIFDVELIARLLRIRRGTDRPPATESIYELPVRTWTDVAGSKLKSSDFGKAIAEMGRIYWR